MAAKSTTNKEISPAEWEIMRIIWALGPTKTNVIVQIMQEKKNWKVSTTKTLLARLTKKGYLLPQKMGREFCYQANVKENTAIDQTLQSYFKEICAMKAGKAINHLIEKVTLSKDDLIELKHTISQRYDSAPDQINCNCVPQTYLGAVDSCCAATSSVNCEKD